MTTDRREHWENVYRSKAPDAVSWFAPHLESSLALLRQAGLHVGSRVIDVGAGASTLVDDLLDTGVTQLTVLDLSTAALEISKQRLGDRATAVSWIAGDVRHVALPEGAFDLWHDRAVLHFLTEPADISAYVATARHALAAGGHAVIGGFAPDGPTQCSQLPVARRSATDIAALFGDDFELLGSRGETHTTPWGASQAFVFAVLRKRPDR